MMYYIYLDENIVRESIPEFDSVFPGIPIEKRYAPDLLAKCVISENPITNGWVYVSDSGTFSEPPVPPELPPIQPMSAPPYAELVQQYIHERYSLDDEMALSNAAIAALENNQALPQDYAEYRAYVVECKDRARMAQGTEI